VKYFKGEKLEKSLLVLKTYSGEKLHSLGVMRVHVQYNDQCSYLNLYMVKRGVLIVSNFMDSSSIGNCKSMILSFSNRVGYFSTEQSRTTTLNHV
jgi:hypothetical protein